MRNFKDADLLVGLVGLGYIGFSTAVYFAKEGIKVVGYDVDQSKVNAFNAGQSYLPNIHFWVGFDFAHLTHSGLARATHELSDLRQARVVFLCLPTEKRGEPCMDYLQKHMQNHATFLQQGALLIIESTMTPGTTQKYVVDYLKSVGREDVMVAVAPRRDWFVQSNWSMAKIPRIVGGSTPEATEYAAEVLKIVCEKVVPATSHREAELVKSTENAYRCMDIVLANQLCFAYPDVNMREVLELVGTKWNMNAYHPNFGIGGYCILPAPKYVLGGTAYPERLGLLQQTVDWASDMALRYAEALVRFRKPVILGVAYKGGLKVDILSPGVGLAKALLQLKAAGKAQCEDVLMCDPMYTDEEVLQLLPGAVTARFPEALAGRDLVVVSADHAEFIVPEGELLKALAHRPVVLDVHGIWARYQLGKHGIPYVLLGEKDWAVRLSGG